MILNRESTNWRMNTTGAELCQRISSCCGSLTKITPKLKASGPTVNLANLTRGLLQRAHVVAEWPPIYIGNESDKHWEEGEDLSLLEFKTIEYKRKGYAIATDEQMKRIAQVPKRELMRRGINQHTL